MKQFTFKTALFLFAMILLTACGRKNIPTTSAPEIVISDDDMRAIEGGKDAEEVKAEDIPTPPIKDIKPMAPHVLLSLQKTDCPGFCPVFELRLFSDGRALYRGTKDVAMIGKFETRLTTEQLTMLIGEADRIRFFDLASAYPTDGVMIRELPTTITSINQLSKAHSVINGFDSPKRLRSFENYVVRFFEGLNWNRIAG